MTRRSLLHGHAASPREEQAAPLGGMRPMLLLAALSILWGMPYLFIKIAVEEISPPLVVAGRTAIAAAILVPIALGTRVLGQLRGRYGAIAVLSAVHVIAPFLLITYGEVYISSSLTALLLATQPALIALLAWRFDPSERVGGTRLLGLGIGLVGVAAVVGLDIGIDDRNGLLGAGMVLLAGVGYACATFLVKRKLTGVAPVATTAATMTITTVVLAPFALLTAPSHMPSLQAAGSVVVLGIFSTALALVLFYRLIASSGAGAAALVSYTSPAVAVLLGVAVLAEPLTSVTVLGFAMILGGSWLSRRQSPLPRVVPIVRPGVKGYPFGGGGH